MHERADMAETKLCVLLVDDEPNVLSGLRRSLRPMRDKLEIVFASGAHEALDIMAKVPLDLIVSDMRMPGMDGIQLLGEVRARFPGIVRFALSGDVSRGALLASAGLVHRYLAKPCDTQELQTALSSVWELRPLVTNNDLKNTLSQIESLPAAPALYRSLVRALDAPSAAGEDVGRIIAIDIAMTTKVLQVAGWALFGDNQLFFSVPHAVDSLGIETLRAMASSGGALASLEHEAFERMSLGPLWNHARSVADFARQIARSSNAGGEIADQAYVGGLLHDVGKLAFAATTPVAHAAASVRAVTDNIGLLDAERDVIGATHPEAGAYLLGIWGLAGPIVEAVRFHHNPSSVARRGFSAVTAVHVADALLGDDSATNLDQPYLDGLGVCDQIETWRALTGETAVA